MEAPTKLCLFCKHCQFSDGYHYSEITYEDPSISCLSGDGLNGVDAPDDKRKFVQWNLAAQTCPVYELDPETLNQD